MPVEISAVFDTPDMADLALMRLRDSRIHMDSFSIQPLKWSRKRSELLPAYAMNSSPQFTGFFLPFMNAAILGDSNAALDREVILTVAVSSPDVPKTLDILVNAFGRNVRQGQQG